MSITRCNDKHLALEYLQRANNDLSRALNSFFEGNDADVDPACDEYAADDHHKSRIDSDIDDGSENETEMESDYHCYGSDAGPGHDEETDDEAPSAPAAVGSRHAATVSAFDLAISRGHLDEGTSPLLASHFPSFAEALMSKELEAATAQCLVYATYAVRRLAI